VAKPSLRRGSALALPWEGRARWLGAFASRSRWQAALLVLAVGGLLFAFVRFADHRRQLHLTYVAIAETHRAIAAFRADVGRCPESPEELVHPPRTGTRYLREIPVDGFGRPLFIACPGRLEEGRPDVVSAGPSGDFFDDDNIW